MLLISQPAPREQVGPLPNGGFLLNSGWRLEPAGRQVALDTFPMAAALSPDGKYVAGPQRRLQSAIHRLDRRGHRARSEYRACAGCVAGFGLRARRRPHLRGRRIARRRLRVHSLAAARCGRAARLPWFPRPSAARSDFVGDVAISPDGRLLYAAELYRDSVAVINLQSGLVSGRYKTGRRPYRILFHPDGQTFFVSHWADGSVGHYDAATGSQLANLRIGAHPTDMAWRAGGPAETDAEGSRPLMRPGSSWRLPTPTTYIRWASARAKSSRSWRASTSPRPRAIRWA